MSQHAWPPCTCVCAGYGARRTYNTLVPNCSARILARHWSTTSRPEEVAGARVLSNLVPGSFEWLHAKEVCLLLAANKYSATWAPSPSDRRYWIYPADQDALDGPLRGDLRGDTVDTCAWPSWMKYLAMRNESYQRRTDSVSVAPCSVI